MEFVPVRVTTSPVPISMVSVRANPPPTSEAFSMMPSAHRVFPVSYTHLTSAEISAKVFSGERSLPVMRNTNNRASSRSGFVSGGRLVGISLNHRINLRSDNWSLGSTAVTSAFSLRTGSAPAKTDESLFADVESLVSVMVVCTSQLKFVTPAKAGVQFLKLSLKAV